MNKTVWVVGTTNNYGNEFYGVPVWTSKKAAEKHAEERELQE